MRKLNRPTCAGSLALLALCVLAPASSARADASADDIALLKQQMEQILRENAELRGVVEELRSDVQRARDEARAAQDMATARAGDSGGLGPVEAAPASSGGGEAWMSRRVGGATLRLIDLSLDTLFAAGSSTATDAELEQLQGGEHDPRQRGFTLQNVELSMLAAVDPYLTGEAHLIAFLDTEGETRFEIEEAFLTTQMLPFGAEAYGLQLEAGQFFTEFGRINPRHPHAWNWQDQPVINSRFFGPDGMRAPGVRMGWLTPLPWFSELHLGVQNAKGETMVSFLAGDEVFEERAVAGRPFGDPSVNGLADLVYLARWVNGTDLSETTSAQLGISALFGPNGTGNDGRTRIYGADLVVKWVPLQTDRGWPFVTWQSEFMFRDYHADNFRGCPEPAPACTPVALASQDLDDWGFYTEALWGFHRGWSAGVRYEYATGEGASYDRETASPLARFEDPNRSDRHRLSPLLVFQPSEYARFRLQYNYDHVTFLDASRHHTAWAGVEFLIGSHAAHAY